MMMNMPKPPMTQDEIDALKNEPPSGEEYDHDPNGCTITMSIPRTADTFGVLTILHVLKSYNILIM